MDQFLGPPLGEGHFGHDDVAGEVLVFRSESVGGPGSEGRIGSQTAACVHVEEGLGVVEGLGLTSAVVAEFVGDVGIGEVLPLVAHLDAVVSDLVEFKRAADVELKVSSGEPAVVL